MSSTQANTVSGPAQTTETLSDKTLSTKISSFDLVIVGGGMSGACMALALAPLPLSIAVIDAVSHDHDIQPSFDDRSVALSYGSVKILQSMGIWPYLKDTTTPIKHIHVSDKGHFGFARLHANELNLPALGYVVENRSAGDVFYQLLKKHENITILSPYQATDMTISDGAAHLQVTKSKQSDESKQGSPGAEPPELERRNLSARLVIAADGTFSKMALMAGIPAKKEAYQQSAIILNAATDQPKNGWAYERFTESGPLAFLPLSHQRYSIVWSIDSVDKERYLAMNDAEFGRALQERFGFRAGNIRQIGQRHVYPLINQKLNVGYGDRLVFIGNALHTSHPVAGQGFNLGLRDIATLAEKIAENLGMSQDIGRESMLKDYWQIRRIDIEQTQQRIDGLARLFVNQNLLLSLSRNLALKWLDVFGPAKKIFAQQAMGLRNDLPLLARGYSVTDILSSSKTMANRTP